MDTVLHTTNGGMNWKPQESNSNDFLNIIYFINELKGFAGGGNGKLNITTNRGQTWTEMSINNHKIIMDIFFVNENTGWFVGDSSLIAKTTDGGDTWNIHEPFTDKGIFSINMIDENEGWCTGTGLLVKTTDGGENWEIQNLPGNDTRQVLFFNSNSGYLSSFLNHFYITHNSGLTWDTVNVSPNYWDFFATSFTFIDSLTGWIAGGPGKIFKTTDGGLSWIQQLNINEGFFDIFFIDKNTGWAVGNEGTIIHTTNGGVTFIEADNIFYLPNEFLLSQNYPNPFNPITKIKYTIPTPPVSSPLVKGRTKEGFVTLKVYDILGREIATLVNEQKPAGEYEVEFDGNAPNQAEFIFIN